MVYLPPESHLETIVFGNLELRPEEYQALVDARRIGLTVREFQVLYALVQQEDRVVRREEIYQRVWGGEMKHRERAVDVFVRKVRNKLSAVAPEWTYIHTHFGIGYRFAPEANDFDSKGGSLDPKGGSFDPKAGSFDPKANDFDSKGGSLDPKGGSFDPKANDFDPRGGSFAPQAAGFAAEAIRRG